LGFPTGWLAPLPIKHFAGALAGRKRISARGVSRFQSFTLLLFCLLSLLYFLLASFYQKYKKVVPL
jgi:hypothetical protein